MGRSYIEGNKKRCNGPLHKGKYIPLDEFWVHKGTHRPGQPFSQCKACLNFTRWGDNNPHGLVPYKNVKFIFDELVFRLGKSETARRVKVSSSFFSRRKRGGYTYIRKAVVARAMIELQKARARNEARHRKSIRHGSHMRGHKVRVPTFSKDFNGKNDHGNEIREVHRKSG